MFRSTTRSMALLVGAALVLAACGGGSDAETAGDDAATTVAETTTTEAEATTTTEAETTTTEAETTTTVAEIAEAELSQEFVEFCVLRAVAEDMGDPDVFDPESLQAWLEDNIALMEEGAALAPEEIADDMAAMVAGAGELRALFEQYDYDLLAIPEDELDAVSVGLDEAGDRVDAFVDANCPEVSEAEDAAEEDQAAEGIDISPDELESLLATEEGRQAVIDGFVATTGLTQEEGACFFEQLPVDELAALAAQDLAGAPSLFDALAACDISIESLLPG